MANQLKMATQNAIVVLKTQNLSNREIARRLGISRNTVNHHLLKTDSNGAKAPPGAEAPKDLCSHASRSHCQAFAEVIEAKVQQDLSAKRIHQDLVTEHGFTGSYYSVRRYVGTLQQSRPLPFRRMEAPPGQEAQIDFGTGAPIITAAGKRRRTHVFRIVLSCSRKAYSEAVYHQTTDEFLRCIENAFWYFGGVTKTLVIDNLKAAVVRADWYDPDIHPMIRSFAEHYGTVILPAKPYTPRHKGKIERGIDYVKANALKGRSFESLVQQNTLLLHWEKTVADTRLHGTTRRHVGQSFQEIERPALGALPHERFACFKEAQRSVHRDGHVEVAKAYYSVPPEYLGQRLWVRWDGRIVRIFNHRMEQIAIHAQAQPGQFQTAREHLHSHKISRVERGADWLLQRVSLMGPSASRWGQVMLQERGIAGIRVLNGLLSLTHHHSATAIDQACQIALTHGAYRLRAIRQILKHGGAEQQQFDFTNEHEIIRNLSEYENLTDTHFT